MGEANVSFLTSGGFYEKHEAFWSGSAGDVFLEGSGVELTDISFSVGTAGYSENVWIMTDVTPRSSVFENNLFYLNKANYTNNLIIGASGMDSTFALSEFKRALEKGTPQYAVWSVGSTEADAADKMNEKYASNTAEFLSICDTKGIIPILSTQANREGADHSFKNAYVEASGRRYIDLAGKLGAKAAGDTTLSDTFYTGEGEARALDLGAIARAEISELVRVLPEIALKKD